MDRFSELRSPQDRELIAREIHHRHPAPEPPRRPGLAGRLMRLARAPRRSLPAAPVPRECAPGHEA